MLTKHAIWNVDAEVVCVLGVPDDEEAELVAAAAG
jgi:hypothetical protein